MLRSPPPTSAGRRTFLGLAGLTLLAALSRPLAWLGSTRPSAPLDAEHARLRALSSAPIHEVLPFAGDLMRVAAESRDPELRVPLERLDRFAKREAADGRDAGDLAWLAQTGLDALAGRGGRARS